jgi:hypothetical protein
MKYNGFTFLSGKKISKGDVEETLTLFYLINPEKFKTLIIRAYNLDVSEVGEIPALATLIDEKKIEFSLPDFAKKFVFNKDNLLKAKVKIV